ncbi:bifunctional 2-keto-4-hydroxyglutarate aldolase/2-keto-3-deoxy-6-phosphogluconate aldolase [Garciella nitratireducens]|uniref:2-dehydro-3-deoxyphosphogluconate aldolase / (4S)-4-hydroxy-2-oxoglutarate aldolase n=1 Tax=Garciella nitratireducens DSM 15102 TaxID=1121911 RepID=A0A1T4P3N2_9FIRM|nr:bifunctional 2-keto-4-hydroxyglutarate aldolase/2-keto-3-deoxy-6-phosphogluconate aldolase [Garciella nitratireducens]SJZ86114.1 2-dehydro-3-deoxyphosphogluconate aldolase / (4S)-4-hydroxy-2-oxoglutarate aldolase [Garciella nitratireducens DSM 15102]
MTQKARILEKLKENYLFAVIRGKSAQDAYEISKAAYQGGIKNIEVTFTTPNANKTIEELAEELKDTDMVVGAGTVMDDVTARIAIIAGARFIVSPNFVPEISTICNRYAIPYLPGCGSVTEIAEAMTTGVEVVKVFPGGTLGPTFIKDIHGPIPQVELMPSGGVSLENMETWVKNGAWAIGIGSALTKNVKGTGYESVTEEAQKFVEKYRENLNTK